jgi:hypothetical protein
MLLVVVGHTQQKQSHKHQQGQEKKTGRRDHADGKAGEASLVGVAACGSQAPLSTARGGPRRLCGEPAKERTAWEGALAKRPCRCGD